MGTGPYPRHVPPLRIAVLHSPLGVGEYPSLPGDAGVAQDDSDAVDAVAEAVLANGMEPLRIAVGADPRGLLDHLAGVAAAFNLVEAVNQDARLTAAVAALLDWVGVPYTGAGPQALSLGLDKPLTRAVLAGHGVAIPTGCVMRAPSDVLTGVGFPAIVKPAHEDASTGIDLGSVASDAHAARARAVELIRTFGQPALVETFVPGREILAGVVDLGDGPRALPLRTVDYPGYPAGAPHLLTFASKWRPESREYHGAVVAFADDLPAGVADAATATALNAWDITGLRHYGRIDLRLDERLTPVVLEVNPNPDLAPTAGLALAAERAGTTYEALIGGIVDAALSSSSGARSNHIGPSELGPLR